MAKKITILVLIALFLGLLPYYVLSAEQKQSFQFSQDRQIQQIKSKKPVKIKLHRTQKGEYSWDLTGDNTDDVVQADRRLRKLLKLE
ncbi:MAG: hypothetical protein A2077_07385 [Nitrospirae bacterium GWC2_46_6]|nr:MAG: hypothetical protein A2Z82_07440 [Nitrospirae bacterium GWA2_46_11]OGW22685.1 MAG: hypothetical protein A2077_07385 [Nitrospirae bacterium GWC2_46_6]OGW24960.1 MAG: hypothetical protein A2X55_08420 [Nitrospirae bacterium GWB2_47_37]HAK88216.1 hypothetical protein [Nitrospiraceae bacterium]HCL81642.1 hypothetical protein [Nitrospiraceae bacterium]